MTYTSFETLRHLRHLFPTPCKTLIELSIFFIHQNIRIRNRCLKCLKNPETYTLSTVAWYFHLSQMVSQPVSKYVFVSQNTRFMPNLLVSLINVLGNMCCFLFIFHKKGLNYEDSIRFIARNT